jgi:hypothetical protein
MSSASAHSTGTLCPCHPPQLQFPSRGWAGCSARVLTCPCGVPSNLGITLTGLLPLCFVPGCEGPGAWEAWHTVAFSCLLFTEQERGASCLATAHAKGAAKDGQQGAGPQNVQAGGPLGVQN